MCESKINLITLMMHKVVAFIFVLIYCGVTPADNRRTKQAETQRGKLYCKGWGVPGNEPEPRETRGCSVILQGALRCC